MRKVNWRRRFNDVQGVLDEYDFPVSTQQVFKTLKKFGIYWGLSATHQTLVSMHNTHRISRTTVKGKDFWGKLPKKGQFENG